MNISRIKRHKFSFGKEFTMIVFKKAVNLIFYYILGIIIANLAVGILSLILKISLITVQGPTLFSQISEIVTYYATLSIASLLLFRLFGKKQPQIKYKEIVFFGVLIVALHLVIIFFAGWGTVWSITTGSLQLTKIMYAGGNGLIESLREIPRLYYFVALVIGDVCFIIFALIGYSKGISK